MPKLNLCFLLIIFSACGNNSVLKEKKIFPGYPSASGIEFFQDKIYVIGDDANNLLILDGEMNTIDSLGLYSFDEKRIPKSLKADLESITITKDKKLLLLGSGSFSPYRDICWLIDPLTKKKDSLGLETFYQNLGMNGIKEINIEGACTVPGSTVLSNRGNKSYPKNYLVITSSDFWDHQSHAPVSLIQVGGSNDTSIFNGISGLAYAAKTDRLILSISSEDTRNSLDDGAIGKSYLWIIENFSSKKRWKAINPDQVVDLENINPEFRAQKIESVCITKETRNFLYLILAADNDNGSSSLFKMIVEKR